MWDGVVDSDGGISVLGFWLLSCKLVFFRSAVNPYALVD